MAEANRSVFASSVVVAGAGLLAAVIGWRLDRGTERADLETLCNAESRSGWTLRDEMPALGGWIRDHLRTRAGHEDFAVLGDGRMAERSARLRAEAGRLGLTACPLAQAYDDLVADGAYRADLQRLCSYATFPDLADRDDAMRLETLEAWIGHDAANPRTKALAAPLGDATTPAERARVLRAAAAAIDIFTCDIAKTLEAPRPTPALAPALAPGPAPAPAPAPALAPASGPAPAPAPSPGAPSK